METTLNDRPELNPYGVGLSRYERTQMQLDTWIDSVLEDLELL